MTLTSVLQLMLRLRKTGCLPPEGDRSPWCTPGAVTSVMSVNLYGMGSACSTHDGDDENREDSGRLLDPGTFQKNAQYLNFRKFQP
jgi:hypothetical protein